VAGTAQRPVETKVGISKVVYKGKSGQWAFVGHRVSGVLVFFFLLLHIVDVSLINSDPVLYDEVHELYGNILLRIFEVGLLFALLFHSLNGLRIVLVDFFPGMVRNERRLFTGVLAITIVVGVPCTWVILEPFISGRIF
jgi:succinate dehydrogenase / fumarate reductase cytochrome b subunit